MLIFPQTTLQTIGLIRWLTISSTCNTIKWCKRFNGNKLSNISILQKAYYDTGHVPRTVSYFLQHYLPSRVPDRHSGLIIRSVRGRWAACKWWVDVCAGLCVAPWLNVLSVVLVSVESRPVAHSFWYFVMIKSSRATTLLIQLPRSTSITSYKRQTVVRDR